jgi:DNA-binding NarL/FixJ family response regulator
VSRRGDRDAATREVGAARELATRLGAAPLVRELESLARRARLGGARAVSGVAASRSDGGPTAPFGLSEREREVLALVASGDSNREIGEKLFISPRTASVHVSNILGKMGASSRVEAATLALRLGLVTDEAADSVAVRPTM